MFQGAVEAGDLLFQEIMGMEGEEELCAYICYGKRQWHESGVNNNNKWGVWRHQFVVWWEVAWGMGRLEKALSEK